ncbi:hypothetical protein M3Y14_04065 [Bacillus thuringiensis]|uniref:hypothetical protein n=1 Tax=Bacillus thuringiensis TaxID=1428 RepID=UPI0022243830|nr:hypothetical protein [Bacillus thuringiensis]UYX53338.1 hypothetical protein M3Y14_04065 [Bacillus thuringiensis]
MDKPKEKQVLIEIDNVRVKEYDSLNVVVERLEKPSSKSSIESVSKWRFKGYAKSIHCALKFIVNSELLIDNSKVEDLQSYVKQVEKSNEEVLNAVKEVIE